MGITRLPGAVPHQIELFFIEFDFDWIDFGFIEWATRLLGYQAMSLAIVLFGCWDIRLLGYCAIRLLGF